MSIKTVGLENPEITPRPVADKDLIGAWWQSISGPPWHWVPDLEESFEWETLEEDYRPKFANALCFSSVGLFVQGFYVLSWAADESNLCPKCWEYLDEFVNGKQKTRLKKSFDERAAVVESRLDFVSRSR